MRRRELRRQRLRDRAPRRSSRTMLLTAQPKRSRSSLPLPLPLIAQQIPLPLRQIRLIPRQHERTLRTRQNPRIVQERAQFGETLASREVVHQHRAGRAAVVTPAHAAKALRARGVPELEFDSLPPRSPPGVSSAADFDDPTRELHANGLGCHGAELVLDEAMEEAGFARAGRAEQDDLREVVVHAAHFVGFEGGGGGGGDGGEGGLRGGGACAAFAGHGGG